MIFRAPSVYSFSHGVDFFLDFFFGFSICYASFDRERLLMEVNSTYYVPCQILNRGRIIVRRGVAV